MAAAVRRSGAPGLLQPCVQYQKREEGEGNSPLSDWIGIGLRHRLGLEFEFDSNTTVEFDSNSVGMGRPTRMNRVSLPQSLPFRFPPFPLRRRRPPLPSDSPLSLIRRRRQSLPSDSPLSLASRRSASAAMGAAFSSDRGKGGSSCRLQIGRAAKVACVALLLFVAGGVAALHLTNSSPPEWIPLRAEAAAERRRELRRNRKLLPRGLAHVTTDLEMEPSLAGDPEWRLKLREAAAPPKPKSLLAVPVGIKNKAIVDKLVSKFLGADFFTVMLFHYDGAVEQWGDLDWSERAVHVAAKGQTKWWFAKRFLHPDVVAAYEYVFVWDEDIEVDAFDPVRYLDIIRREGLEVSQPALDRRSEIHHAITARALQPAADGVHRRVRDARCSGEEGAPPCVGWVEVMVPVFSRAAWRCAWRMLQNDLIHGWGLDYKLGYCAHGDRAVSVGVVDSEYVLHRGIPVLSDGGKATPAAGRAAVRHRSGKEMQLFNKRWEAAAAEDKTWTDRYAAAEPPREASSG